MSVQPRLWGAGVRWFSTAIIECVRGVPLISLLFMAAIMLPQALTITIPSQVNTFIGLFKDTTLVVVIGVFDFFTTLRAALGDPN